METKTLTIGKVNSVSLLLLENGEKLIPIKPICEALGVDMESQRKKIKEDELLSSTAVLSTAVAGDGNAREMYCLPLKYVFGWLFTINPKNVKEEAREAVQKYRTECYDVLYRHFTKYQDFVIERGNKVDYYLDIYRKAQEGYKNAQRIMSKAKADLDAIRKKTFEDYEAEGDQLNLFPDEDNPRED
jgi:hypothetical protein